MWHGHKEPSPYVFLKKRCPACEIKSFTWNFWRGEEKFGEGLLSWSTTWNPLISLCFILSDFWILSLEFKILLKVYLSKWSTIESRQVFCHLRSWVFLFLFQENLVFCSCVTFNDFGFAGKKETQQKVNLMMGRICNGNRKSWMMTRQILQIKIEVWWFKLFTLCKRFTV